MPRFESWRGYFYIFWTTNEQTRANAFGVNSLSVVTVMHMRKDTKKQVMALFIVLIFGLSSIAFFFTSFFGGSTQQQNDIKPLEKFVLDGQVDSRVEDAYYRSGFTWMKVYYSDKNDRVYTTVEQLPDLFKTPDGQTQLVVQRLQANSTLISIYSVNGREELLIDADENEIISKLCSVVVLPPADCAFLNQTNTA